RRIDRRRAGSLDLQPDVRRGRWRRHGVRRRRGVAGGRRAARLLAAGAQRRTNRSDGCLALRMRGAPMPTFLLRDLRYGWRVLIAKPGFAVAAILTLALGIGANALVFALIDGVYMRDLPYRQSNALVDVYSSMAMFGGGYDTVSVPDYVDIHAQ